MKLFKKLLSVVAVCVCCIALAASAGCQTYENSENCGGIVKGYKCLGEKENHTTFPQDETWTVTEIEITFNNNCDIIYPFTIVSQSYFDYYNCTTVDDLFKNIDFKDTYSTAMTLEVRNGKAILEMNTAFKSNTSVYFYEAVTDNNGEIKINDFNNYIGYFHYN